MRSAPFRRFWKQTCRYSVSVWVINFWHWPAVPRTVKMKLGHHGANHPVRLWSRQGIYLPVRIMALPWMKRVLPDYLQADAQIPFRWILQGIHRTDKAAFGFQGHPEASPGPHDIAPVFDHFIELMQARRPIKT